MPFWDLQRQLGIDVDRWLLRQSMPQPYGKAAACHAFEREWVECGHGLGQTRARRECQLEYEDFMECMHRTKLVSVAGPGSRGLWRVQAKLGGGGGEHWGTRAGLGTLEVLGQAGERVVRVQAKLLRRFGGSGAGWGRGSGWGALPGVFLLTGHPALVVPGAIRHYLSAGSRQAACLRQCERGVWPCSSPFPKGWRGLW